MPIQHSQLFVCCIQIHIEDHKKKIAFRYIGQLETKLTLPTAACLLLQSALLAGTGWAGAGEEGGGSGGEEERPSSTWNTFHINTVNNNAMSGALVGPSPSSEDIMQQLSSGLQGEGEVQLEPRSPSPPPFHCTLFFQ